MTVDFEFQIITLILSEHQCHKFSRIARDKDIRGGTVVIGKGTVSSATLNLFGIKSQKREIVSIMVEKERARKLLDYFTEELQLDEPGHGIAYVTPAMVAEEVIKHTPQNMEGDIMYKKMTVIVNRGMADTVMEIARNAGVKGGTVIHGRGTGSEFTEKLLGIEIVPEKELVIILMPEELVSKVASELYRELQLDVTGNGILFVEPVVEVRGLSDSHHDKDKTHKDE